MTGKLVQSIIEHQNESNQVIITPDGKKIISGGTDKLIKIWDFTTGKLTQTFPGHTGKILSLAISRNGKYIVSGSSDGKIKLWELSTGNLIITLRRGGWVNSVAISHDGSIIICGSRAKDISGEFITFWDALSGKIILKINGHKNLISSLKITANEKFIVSAVGDYLIKIWNFHDIKKGWTFIKSINIPNLINQLKNSTNEVLIKTLRHFSLGLSILQTPKKHKQFKIPKLVNIIIELLAHSNPKVRALAANILKYLNTPKAIKTLIKCLDDEKYIVRIEAALSLGQNGQKIAIKPLTKYLKYAKREVQLEILNTLKVLITNSTNCLLYTSPSPRDLSTSRMPSSA